MVFILTFLFLSLIIATDPDFDENNPLKIALEFSKPINKGQYLYKFKVDPLCNGPICRAIVEPFKRGTPYYQEVYLKEKKLVYRNSYCLGLDEENLAFYSMNRPGGVEECLTDIELKPWKIRLGKEFKRLVVRELDLGVQNSFLCPIQVDPETVQYNLKVLRIDAKHECTLSPKRGVRLRVTIKDLPAAWIPRMTPEEPSQSHMRNEIKYQPRSYMLDSKSTIRTASGDIFNDKDGIPAQLEETPISHSRNRMSFTPADLGNEINMRGGGSPFQAKRIWENELMDGLESGGVSNDQVLTDQFRPIVPLQQSDDHRYNAYGMVYPSQNTGPTDRRDQTSIPSLDREYGHHSYPQTRDIWQSKWQRTNIDSARCRVGDSTVNFAHRGPDSILGGLTNDFRSVGQSDLGNSFDLSTSCNRIDFAPGASSDMHSDMTGTQNYQFNQPQ